MTSLDTNQPLSQNKSSKIYSPRLQQLRDSIVQSKAKIKTKTESKSELPYLNVSQMYPKKEQKLLSYSNRHLRYLFHEFCKQSYIGGSHGTFDQIAQSSEIMTLNKWMVFCKQFQLTQKLSNRQAMQIFKIVTQQRPQMNVFQFCRALQVVQQKTKLNPQSFATEILHVDSHLSARKRMCVMKINFSGPKTNFFMQSRLTQNEREQEKKQIKQYKQKQRQYVLHQGMFKQQIQLLMLQRKSQRNRKFKQLRSRGGTQKSFSRQDQQRIKQQKQKQRIKKQPLINISGTSNIGKRRTKDIFANYSKIYETKKISKTDSTQNSNRNESGGVNKSSKNGQDLMINESESKSRIKYEQIKYNNNSQLLRQQENVSQLIEKLDENYQIDSEAQSDIILRSHYENQKRIKQIKSKQLQKVSKPDKLQKLEKIEKLEKLDNLQKLEKGLHNNQNENDDDLMITRYS